jgi:hypothetical protein
MGGLLSLRGGAVSIAVSPSETGSNDRYHPPVMCGQGKAERGASGVGSVTSVPPCPSLDATKDDRWIIVGLFYPPRESMADLFD